jgi:protein-tyrosine phosphatase
VPEPDPFVDIHCHLLPGIDDGPADWAESLAMARMAANDGISTAVATPHQLGSYACNTGEQVRARCRELQGLLDREGIALRVLPGGDVRIEPDLVGKIRTGEVVTLADGRRYVLLELPHEIYFPLDRLLRSLHASGLVGILSHPERNLGILGQPEVVEPLVDAGCLLQVTAGSLVGTFGAQVRSFAESLVVQGFAHFIATDGHGVKSRRPLMRRAFARAAEIAGDRSAAELCSENPRRVVAGEVVAPGRRAPRRGTWGGWLRWGKAG